MSAQLRFFDSHQPALEDGLHTLKAVHSPPGDKPFELTATIHVAGPRFTLDPQQVDTVFPPNGSLGDHQNVLPHIALKRGTLPWERRLAGGDATLPWLALLVFDQDDGSLDVRPDPSVPVKVGQLKNIAAPLEPGQTADDVVTTICVPWLLLKSVLPTPDELRYLAHVRQRSDDASPGAISEVAVVIANRLPSPSHSSVVHLVSLEGRMNANGLDPNAKDDPSASDDKSSVTLVSLFSWRFACVDASHSFLGTFESLNSGGDPSDLSFRIPALTTVVPQLEPLLKAGAAPLRQTLRDGNTTVSWYHGPLSPGITGLADPGAARHADEHLVQDAATGFQDVSYSTAWELGRWLTVRNTRVATEIFLWKRRHAQTSIIADQDLIHHAYAADHGGMDIDIPTVVDDWFKSLRLLKNIPLHYLVPRGDMLPPESIRFFTIDACWLDALFDGAFSVGRASDAQAEKDDDLTPPAKSGLSGFLLRSRAVSYWPDLLCTGWSVPVLSDTAPPAQALMTIARRDLLGPGVLLVIFNNTQPAQANSDGSLRSVDFFLKPEAMHHGFLFDKQGFGKHLRSHKDGTELDPPVRVSPMFRNTDQHLRCIKITDLVGKLQGNSKLDVDGNTTVSDTSSNGFSKNSSGAFGLAMIEGSDRMRFRVM